MLLPGDPMSREALMPTHHHYSFGRVRHNPIGIGHLIPTTDLRAHRVGSSAFGNGGSAFGGDLSGIPIIGPILHGLFGLGMDQSDDSSNEESDDEIDHRGTDILRQATLNKALPKGMMKAKYVK